MKFKSDSQRRACFANMNKFSLYYDKKSKTVKSNEYPNINLKIVSSVKGITDSDIMQNINSIIAKDIVPEHGFAGVETLSVEKKDKSDHPVTGYYISKDVAGRVFDRMMDMSYKKPRDEYESFANIVHDVEKSHDFKKAEKVFEDYSNMRDKFISESPKIGLLKSDIEVPSLIGEVGHHLMTESGYDYKGELQEPGEEVFITNVLNGYSGNSVTSFPEGSKLKDAEDLIGFATSVGELKNPSIRRMIIMSGVNE